MSLNILVIDDDTEISDLLQELASRSGHQVAVVNDSRLVNALLSPPPI